MADRELRDALEAAQAELVRLRARNAELEETSPEALQERIAELQQVEEFRWSQLERADAQRVEWARRLKQLESELSAAVEEQRRLRRQLETERAEKKTSSASELLSALRR